MKGELEVQRQRQEDRMQQVKAQVQEDVKARIREVIRPRVNDIVAATVRREVERRVGEQVSVFVLQPCRGSCCADIRWLCCSLRSRSRRSSARTLSGTSGK